MILHPVYFLFMFFLIFSLFLTLSTSSWLMAWIALEINMLSFIPLILKKKNKYSSESSIKYFLTQAFASIMIITSMLSVFQFNIKEMNLVLLAALSLKIGAAPFHQWVPATAEGLTWQTIITLLILQKINPLALMSMTPFIIKEITSMLYMIIIISATIGAVGGLAQTSLRKIMVYSSIAHLAWMMSAIYSSSGMWIIYFMLYSMILFSTLNIMNLHQTFTLNQLITNPLTYSILFMMCFFSLSGLPPFSGFVPKWLVSIILIDNKETFLLLFLLFSSFISLFFYMRIIMTNALLISSHKINIYSKSNKKIKKTLINLLFLLLPSTLFLLY